MGLAFQKPDKKQGNYFVAKFICHMFLWKYVNLLIKFLMTLIVFYVVNSVIIVIADPDSDPWTDQEKSFACIPSIVNQTQLNWISIKLSLWVKFDWVQQLNQIELTQKYEGLSCFSINTYFHIYYAGCIAFFRILILTQLSTLSLQRWTVICF